MNHYKYKFQTIKNKHDTHNPSELRTEREVNVKREPGTGWSNSHARPKRTGEAIVTRNWRGQKEAIVTRYCRGHGEAIVSRDCQGQTEANVTHECWGQLWNVTRSHGHWFAGDKTMFNHYKCETTARISALFCKVLGGQTCTSDILFINMNWPKALHMGQKVFQCLSC